MKFWKIILLLLSHGVIGFVGFAAGIYTLPIITAPDAPSVAEVRQLAGAAEYRTEFVRDLKDSDGLHWGEGTVAISADIVTLMGELAPGPDYRLYFAKEFVETELDFKRLKSTMVDVGDIKTFKNFAVTLPEGFDPSEYNTVIVWCESFNQFITAAQYQS